MYRCLVRRLFPFLAWFPPTRESLKADLLAGFIVALVLVPQSMAYAQLAGLPAHYGLYASIVPVAVGALWGSSRQLATGPVAMVSLLTGSTLAQFAAAGSQQFIAYAIVLALMVGVLQVALGLARLGAAVSFLSHPVIAGFTNAAAIIIALSQLDKLLGVPINRSEHFLTDVVEMLGQVTQAHPPTLVLGCGAIAIMLSCRRYAPRLPGVLIAVVLGTLISWATGFERNASVPVEAIADPTVRGLTEQAARVQVRVGEWRARIAEDTARLKALGGVGGAQRETRLALQFEIEAMRGRIQEAAVESRGRLHALRAIVLVRASGADGKYFSAEGIPAGVEVESTQWRVARVSGDSVLLRGGGDPARPT